MNLRALYNFCGKLDLTIRCNSNILQTFYTDKGIGGKTLKVISLQISARELFLHPNRSNYHLFRQLCHELGHYLIAPPGRRHREDYGIPNEAKRKASANPKWDLDELKACLIENHLSGKFGGKYLKNPLSRNIYSRARLHIPTANQWWKETGQEMIDRILKEHNVK